MFGTFSRGERLRLAVAVVFGLMGGLGCMSFNLGNRTYETPASYVDNAGVLKQNGESPLVKTLDDRIEIYFPRPFAATPHLSLGKGSNSVPASEIELLEQHPDHFTIRWKATGGEAILAWRAEGMPGATTATAPVATAPIPLTPTGGR